jgi:hypothetical protein
MKFTALFILTLTLFYYPLTSTADDTYPCANETFQHLLFSDSMFKKAFDEVNRKIEQNASADKLQDAILEIPIVFHILHNGEPVGTGTNISDAQIIDAVRGANERWRRATTAEGVDMEVQFCLAQFDPDGNPSNGIVRKDASSIPQYTEHGISYIGALGQPGSDEVVTKNFSNWRHDYVYNIWVVNKIAGGWGGYAFFPFNFNYPTDGTVIISTATRYSSSTLAHELGHGMGLFHTFQGSENGCPLNGICAILGDWVCDTPPHRQTDCAASSCHNSADSSNSYRNIMSYCPNRVLFTQGQKKRSRDIITATSRNALVSSLACTGIPCTASLTELSAETCNTSEAGISRDTLVNTAGCDSIVTTTTSLIPAPVASFTYELNGNNIVFSNTSEHGISYTWNFGDDSVSTDNSPAHQYSSPGTYTVSLTAENSCTTSVAQQEISVSFTTGIRQQMTETILLYPNPGNGNFTVKTAIPANMNTAYLELSNMLGQRLYQIRLTPGNEHFIQLENKLSAGMYQVQLILDNKPAGQTLLSIF